MNPAIVLAHSTRSPLASGLMQAQVMCLRPSCEPGSNPNITVKQLLISAAGLVLLVGCGTKPKEEPLPTVQPIQAPDSAAETLSGLTVGAGPAGRITTASGLQYRVLSSGPAGGTSPKPTDSVTVHYRGTLTDGTVFDSSYDRGEPTTFRVNQVIPGWTEALQLMKPGDKWMLYIPARLAYGPRGVGAIPPNSDLIFQVELIQVQSGF